MEDKTKQLSKEQQERIAKEEAAAREKLEIIAKADETREQNFAFDENGALTMINEINGMTIQEIDNPQEKYDLYYKILNKLLRSYLPKGPENQKVRNVIYEEKNTFITRGYRIKKDGTRGADGRMGYSTDISEFIEIVRDCYIHNATMMELYTRLRDLNISKGYGRPSMDS